MAGFVRLRKDKENEEKMMKLSQFLKSHISGTLEVISLKFRMWCTEVGGRVHSKNCLVLLRQHRATEVQISCFLSFCQYTGVLTVLRAGFLGCTTHYRVS